MNTAAARGMPGSGVEVTNVSKHGFWLLVGDRELFLPYAEFPWFRDATLPSLLNVEEPTTRHFYWPELDVDLGLDTIEQPERFQLASCK